MRERKEGRTRIADDIDEGVGPSTISKEQLQQIVESNIHPYLPGIRFHVVKLTGARHGHVAFVIDVPAGTTAYQASDRLYYRRSEFESKSLRDHVIRLLMMRGQAASAELVVSEPVFLSSKDRAKVWRWGGDVAREFGFVPNYLRSHPRLEREAEGYCFRLVVFNTGERTIDDFLLSLRFDLDAGFALLKPDGAEVALPQELRLPLAVEKRTRPMLRIFPGDKLEFPVGQWYLEVPKDTSLAEAVAVVRWAIYLDDSPPSSGELDLGAVLASVPGR